MRLFPIGHYTRLRINLCIPPFPTVGRRADITTLYPFAHEFGLFRNLLYIKRDKICGSEGHFIFVIRRGTRFPTSLDKCVIPRNEESLFSLGRFLVPRNDTLVQRSRKSLALTKEGSRTKSSRAKKGHRSEKLRALFLLCQKEFFCRT